MERPLNIQELDDLCDEHIALTIALEQINLSLKDTKDKIVGVCTGRETASTKKYVINITRGEAWTWNQNSLAKLLRDVPEIKRVYTIDKKDFPVLSKSKQNKLLTALTTKVGRTTIKISSKEEPIDV